MSYRLAEEYIRSGFHIAKHGENSLALKNRENTIFIFGSELDINEEFVDRLCESYLNILTIDSSELN